MRRGAKIGEGEERSGEDEKGKAKAKNGRGDAHESVHADSATATSRTGLNLACAHLACLAAPPTSKDHDGHGDNQTH